MVEIGGRDFDDSDWDTAFGQAGVADIWVGQTERIKVKTKTTFTIFILIYILSSLKAGYIVYQDIRYLFFPIPLVFLFYFVLIVFRKNLKTSLSVERNSLLGKIKNHLGRKTLVVPVLFFLMVFHLGAGFSYDIQHQLCYRYFGMIWGEVLTRNLKYYLCRNFHADNMLWAIFFGFLIVAILILPEKKLANKR